MSGESLGMVDYHLLYLEHLGDGDLDLMARVAGARLEASELRTWFRAEPNRISKALTAPELYEELFGDTSDRVFELGVTPFFTFVVLVNQTVRDLGVANYVPEWVGAGQRLPVFDVESLQDFIQEPGRRYFVAAFLSSFTRVASGSVWVRTHRGLRRRRYSELDPVRLAEVVEQLPAAQRSSGYRRLGDVSLFLSGVFPDHTARHPLDQISMSRLMRISGLDPEEGLEAGDSVRFFEMLGARWYERAVEAATPLLGVSTEPLEDLAARFTDARRFLNYLTDRYLHKLDTGLMHPAA